MPRFGKLASLTAAAGAIVLAGVASPASAYPLQAKDCEFQTVTDTARLVNFIPPHVRGDRDFAGHGPRVSIFASLETGSDLGGDPTVKVNVDMRD